MEIPTYFKHIFGSLIFPISSINNFKLTIYKIIIFLIFYLFYLILLSFNFTNSTLIIISLIFSLFC